MTTIPPAPLDPAEVELALAPFGESRLLPRDAYVSADVLEWERRHLFADWMCVGRSSDVPPTGTRAESVGGYGVLLVRDQEGVLRAFENVCRHRGHELLPCGGTGTAKRAIVCPYHAWSYKPDGSLIGAPNFRDIDEHYDRSTLGLTPVRVHEWHGWIFIDRTGTAADFSEHIGGLDEIISSYDAESLVTAESHTYDVEANWKVIIENYQECYHCSMIHPELVKISPPTSGENYQERSGDWVGGWMDLRAGMETMSLDGRSGGVKMARLDEHEQSHVLYAAVLPNLLISLHPDYVMSHLLVPLSPGDADHLLVGLPAGGGRDRVLQPGVRRGLLGPHQPSGLGRVRVGAARHEGASVRARAAGAQRGRRVPVRHLRGACLSRLIRP